MSLTKIKATGIDISSVTEAVISPGSITAEKIANNAITAEKIGANAITLDKLETNVVTQIASAGGGGSGVILMTNTLISSNLLIPEGKNGLSVGPVTIATGSNVTITPGQRWLIL